MRKIILALFSIFLALFTIHVHSSTKFEFNNSTADYYIQNFIKDTSAINSVTAIYLNYRVFDTIFETLMLLISVAAVINFSWRHNHD